MNKPLGLVVLLVVATTLLNVCQAQNSTTCVFQAGAYTSYDSVLQCFYSIPFDPVVKNQTIDALKKAVELYAFLDIANDSPDPNLPMKVNILGGLDAIAKRPYKYDYEFQDDLRALFVQLNDAHTQYYTPLCYRALSVAQPIGPVSYVSNGQQVVAVSPFFDPNLVDYYQRTYNINVTSYEGAIITAVDGQPALQYFLSYANHSMGMCKDLGTRLNYAMTIVKPLPNLPGAASPGYWQNRTKRNPLPRQPNVDYTFQLADGSTVDVSIPWVASSINTYTGVSSFMKDYWATDKPLPTKQQVKRKLASPSIDREPRALLQRIKVPESVAASGNSYTLLASSPDLWFWQLSDNKTLVMYLDTMAPTNYVATFAALNRGFNAAAENNLTQLIIDLTDNGGGSICFGQTLLAYLQGDLPESQNWGPQDLPCSPLQVNLTLSAVSRKVEDTVWSPAFYDNQQDVHIANNDTSYLIPGVPHVRGGKLRNYTRLVHINNCGEFGYKIKPAKYFKPQEIMIVTHGFCGSTCALFANHLNLYDNVTAIVVGGIQGRAQQYTSFPGLQVLDSPDLYAQFAELGQEISVGNAQPGELCPRRLPTTGAYRMCIREIYPPVPKYSTKPIEFTFQQAEFHLDNSYQTATAPENIWYQVATMFPSSKRQ